jgi:hypothetical protein
MKKAYSYGRGLTLGGWWRNCITLSICFHTTSQSEKKVKGALVLDVVVGERATILQLFAGKDESLLVGGDSFFVLNFLLNVVDRVGALNFKGDGLV